MTGSDPDFTITLGGKMRVFLSWSGEKSKMTAKALRSNLGKLSGRLEPWLSEDMEPGIQWASTLTHDIQEAHFTILCLTRRNSTAPWITFEAGICHSNPISNENVIPYLLDLDSDELDFPLALFQAVKADWRGTKVLFWKIAKAVGMKESEFTPLFTGEIWSGLEDQLRSIKSISIGGERVEESGAWLNLANAYYLGHDLRWTMAAIGADQSFEDIRHGLRQVMHQADELGMSNHEDFLILAGQCAEVLESDPAEWSPEKGSQLREDLNDAFRSFGHIIKQRQPGYQGYPPENQESWLRIKRKRRA
jgi:hypothetical protein